MTNAKFTDMGLTLDKRAIFNTIETELQTQGFEIVKKDLERPWGGFFVINEFQADAFVETFFPDESVHDLVGVRKVSPKILVVAPGMRLSWQYHNRRSEVWQVVQGSVGIIRSETDEQSALITLNEGDKIVLAQGERHRLVGLDDFGVVAEIWQHTDIDHPSNEKDIVRLQDDFGR